MPDSEFLVRLSRLTDVKDRSADLLSKMMESPDRPFWQVEMMSILCDTLLILSELDTSIPATSSLLSSYENRISSLETRYSQLLYHIKA